MEATSATIDSAQPANAFEPAVRVWLVDDNDQLRELVAETLGRMGGIDCVRHFSSPDALLSTLASKPGPDVILLDVHMGERNGLDAVRPIKSLTRSTRVMMFTTLYDGKSRERALGEGASDYLLKTDDIEQVARRIRTPAEDPSPGVATRRRRHCPAPATEPRSQNLPAKPVAKPAPPEPPATLQNRQTSLLADRAPRFLGRTLKMLRILSN